MIKYAVERVSEALIKELKVLLELHWEEIAMYQDKIVFNPDYDSYKKLDEAEALQVVIVRKCGEIIGYYISFIFTHPHYKDYKFAQNDILFIHPEHRGGTVAYRMFKYAEKKLKKAGCSVNMIHMKTEHPFERLCEAIGMRNHEIVFSKYIGD